MRKLIIVLAVVCSTAMTTKAEPGPVAQWLMNEPASKWDVGMLRLKEYVIRLKKPKLLSEPSKYVEYHWNENRIDISAYFRGRIFDKRMCQNTINLFRISGEVINGKANMPRGYSAYAQAFWSGYDINNKTKNWLQQLDQIIRVTVYMKGGSCAGGLLSDEILYGE